MEILPGLPKESIDMVFADPPYGTTKNAWDVQIPFEDYIDFHGKRFLHDQWLLYAYQEGITLQSAKERWKEEKADGLWSLLFRLLKRNGVVALWSQSPFDKEVAMSDPKDYRYEYIIEKTKATGHLNAEKMPLKCHENILIFYRSLPVYHPQMTEGHPPVHTYTKHTMDGTNYNRTKTGISGGGQTTRYPRDVLKFSWNTQKSRLHATQKPVAACEYFIRTFTDPGDTVLDFSMGSGTTGVASKNLGRSFIGIEKDQKIFETAKKRIEKA